MTDTSPQRLAAIKEWFTSENTIHIGPAATLPAIADLLAMLENQRISIVNIQAYDREMLAEMDDRIQLKDRQIDIYDTTLQQMKEYTAKLRAELHEQRWRKLSEEEPALSEMILVHGKDRLLAVICFGVNDISEKWEYWHPISPPPKE